MFWDAVDPSGTPRPRVWRVQGLALLQSPRPKESKLLEFHHHKSVYSIIVALAVIRGYFSNGGLSPMAPVRLSA